MIDTGGRERIVDLTDTTQTRTQVDRPCCTTVVTELKTTYGTLITVAVAAAMTSVGTIIAIDRGTVVTVTVGMVV